MTPLAIGGGLLLGAVIGIVCGRIRGWRLGGRRLGATCVGPGLTARLRSPPVPSGHEACFHKVEVKEIL